MLHRTLFLATALLSFGGAVAGCDSADPVAPPPPPPPPVEDDGGGATDDDDGDDGDDDGGTVYAIPARGSAATLDVGSWNVFYYGREGQGASEAFQPERVEAAIEQSGVDVWALQEVADETAFALLTAALADDTDDPGYQTLLGPSNSQSFGLRLAFVYDPATVTFIEQREVPGLDPFLFAFRPPIELRASVATADGAAVTARFIALHAKASSDSDSYNRRLAASAELKAYIDGRLAAAPDEPVYVLGDFNDELTRSITSSQPDSPYANFLGDPAYTFATLATEKAGLGTFCGSDDACGGSSTIDHILFAGPAGAFLPATGNAQLQRYGELLDVFTQYTDTASDHLPVVASFGL